MRLKVVHTLQKMQNILLARFARSPEIIIKNDQHIIMIKFIIHTYFHLYEQSGA